MNTFYDSRWHFNVWDGLHPILDVTSWIGVEHFGFWMVYLLLGTVNLIFWRTFYFWGWVFGDLEDILCILDGDYAIWDDYLVFELMYFVFLLVCMSCWDTYLMIGITPVYI